MMNTPTFSREQTATAVIEKSRPLSENRVLLHGVSWETFEGLLADVGDRRTSLHSVSFRAYVTAFTARR